MSGDRVVETTDAEGSWSLRLFVMLIFAVILVIGGASAYYILANTNWDAIADKNLAVTTRLFYVYSALLGVCLLGALAWLAADERRIRKLRQQLEKEKAKT